MIVESQLSAAKFVADWGWVAIAPYGPARDPGEDDPRYGPWVTARDGSESLRLEDAGGSYRPVVHEQRRYVITIAVAPGQTVLACRWGGSDLPPLSTGDRSIHQLDTGNSVGLSKLTVVLSGAGPVEIPFRIANRKLEADDDYEWLVSDLARSVRAVALNLVSSTHLPTSRRSRQRSLGYEDLIFLLSVLEDLKRALERITARPHRKLTYETVWREVGSVSEVAPGSLMALAGARSALARVSRHTHERVLPAGARERFRTRDRKPVLPSLLPTRTRHYSYDTFENRFVKHVLVQFESRARTVSRQLAAAGKADLAASGRGLEAECRSFLRSPFFSNVGVLTSMQATSQVLLRDDSYNRILRIYQEFLLSSDVDWKGLRQVQENHDVAELYEMWVYMEIVRALHNVIGGKLSAPRDASPVVATSAAGLTVSLMRDKASGLRMRASDGSVVTAYYNRRFGGRAGELDATAKSYSLPLRPDVVVEIEDAEGRRFVLLDAKYRVDRIGSAFTAEDDDPAESVAASTFKAADVHKMHAYRDAIDDVAAALAVYPGAEPHSALFPRVGFSVSGGVGAVPLRPGTSMRRSALYRSLRLAMAASSRTR